MSTIQLNLPESVLDEARKLATKDNIPLDYYVALIVTRHIAARQGLEYLQQRAKGASRERFLEILAQAPDVPPIPGDEIE
jgi:hypothetical protein